jgi:hypothetical protein
MLGLSFATAVRSLEGVLCDFYINSCISLSFFSLKIPLKEERL